MQTISGRQFPQKVIPLIDQTDQTIDIVVFDWRWYPYDPGASVQLFNQAIIRAARRGVKVRAIVNSDSIINILRAEGVQAKKLASKNLMHCKLMILDGQKVVIGSHNYTQNAFDTNFELSVILDVSFDCADFFNFFNSLWA